MKMSKTYLGILELDQTNDHLLNTPSLVTHWAYNPMNKKTLLDPKHSCSAQLNLGVDLPGRVADIELECNWVRETTSFLWRKKKKVEKQLEGRIQQHSCLGRHVKEETTLSCRKTVHGKLLANWWFSTKLNLPTPLGNDCNQRHGSRLWHVLWTT